MIAPRDVKILPPASPFPHSKTDAITDYASIFPGGRWWFIGAFATLGLGLPGAVSGLLSRKLLALCFLGLCAAYLVYIALQQRNRNNESQRIFAIPTMNSEGNAPLCWEKYMGYESARNA